MADQEKPELLLGKHTPVTAQYTPALLYPIVRSEGRKRLGLTDPMPFEGFDLWHAYEMSWLDERGKPVARVGRFVIPASSPHIIESKSFKLYLNSLNHTRFPSEDAARSTILRDVSLVVGAEVSLELYAVDDPGLAGTGLVGKCLDALPATIAATEPNPEMLKLRSSDSVEEKLYSHLLRSLCPVTGQPDWATVWIHYRGAALDHSSLLQYIIAYREHQEFHEQCVERMFSDIYRRCAPRFLYIQAFYTRRGGLDINPLRSSEAGARPLPRLNRQ